MGLGCQHLASSVAEVRSDGDRILGVGSEVGMGTGGIAGMTDEGWDGTRVDRGFTQACRLVYNL